MSAETDFRALLAGYAPLTAIVSTRIAQDTVPEGSTGAVVVFATRHDPITDLQGLTVADLVTITVQCWAETGVLASSVADAVTAAVATAPAARSALVLDRSTTFEPDLQLDGVLLTVQWWA